MQSIAGGPNTPRTLETRLEVLLQSTRIELSNLESRQGELQANIDAPQSPAAKYSPHALISLSAQIVWSHLVVILLGMKIARESYVWRRRIVR